MPMRWANTERFQNEMQLFGNKRALVTDRAHLIGVSFLAQISQQFGKELDNQGRLFIIYF